MTIETIKFSQMTAGGDLAPGDQTPGLLGGANVLFENPWTFLAPGPTAERPIPSMAIDGRLRFNTDTLTYEYYDTLSATWVELSGSGTGTVNPGATNDLAYYASAGTAITPITAAANSVLITNSSSLPSLSTTLPTGLTIPGATITGSTAALTAGSVVAAPVAGIDLVNKTYADSLYTASVHSITGTTNQIIVSTPTGDVTLSLPQDIATGSTPTFAGLTLTSIPLNPASGGTGTNSIPSDGQVLVGNGGIYTPTAIASGTGILVGNAAGSVTVSLAPISTLNLLANLTGGSAAPTAHTLSAIIDATIGTTQGDILYRNSSIWTVLAPGTSGQFLQTQGAAANPQWVTSSTVTPAALTSSNDTNVTITLGGSPSTALLQATSLTMGWSGQLSLTRGGTNNSLTASAGGIVWSDASKLNILSGTATAGQLLQSGSSATPAWSTTTYPSTNAINTLLYASSANVMAALATVNDGVLVTSNSGVPSWLANSGTPGYVLTANSGAPPSWQNIQADGAITSVNGDSGSITPTTGAITINGGSTGLTTSGTGSTLSLTGTLNVSHGGSGLSSATAYAVLCGGTTSTGAFQSIASVGTAGQVLTSNGAGALPTMQTLSGTGGLKSFQVFTSGTAQTYTKPANVTSILVEVVGGGGGGGGSAGAASSFAAAGGGGSGGYARLYVASAASTYTYTVGSGGAGGTAGANNGTGGGTTTFSASSLQATGGAGGIGAASGTTAAGGAFNSGGNCGTGSNGNINGGGQPGQAGNTVLGNLSSGNGGSSIYGGGGLSITSATGAGANAVGYGSGGSGATSTTSSAAGGAGSAGIIIIWEFA